MIADVSDLFDWEQMKFRQHLCLQTTLQLGIDLILYDISYE